MKVASLPEVDADLFNLGENHLITILKEVTNGNFSMSAVCAFYVPQRGKKRGDNKDTKMALLFGRVIDSCGDGEGERLAGVTIRDDDSAWNWLIRNSTLECLDRCDGFWLRVSRERGEALLLECLL